MKSARYWILLAAALLLADCGTRSSASVKPTLGADPAAAQAKLPPKAPQSVIVTEGDITDRPYMSLGDISVTVSKWTLFDADPTREKVAEALRAKAGEMGADAVVLTRYGTVGIGALSWGEMEGQGRAVAFK